MAYYSLEAQGWYKPWEMLNDSLMQAIDTYKRDRGLGQYKYDNAFKEAQLAKLQASASGETLDQKYKQAQLDQIAPKAAADLAQTNAQTDYYKAQTEAAGRKYQPKDPVATLQQQYDMIKNITGGGPTETPTTATRKIRVQNGVKYAQNPTTGSWDPIN